MKPELGKQYEVWVFGEPVPKTTQRPPKGPKAYWVVQQDNKYARLRRTWNYQRHVAECALEHRCPRFGPDDPIRLSLDIHKSERKTGDTKNIIAAIEDGLQYGGFIPNDRQVTSYGEIKMYFCSGKDKAGVIARVELDPRVDDFDWLTGWLGTEKKAKEYQNQMQRNTENGT